MNTQKDIQDFVAQKTFAIVGMSRTPKSFSQYAARELRERGYRLFFVNPKAAEIEGEKCYSSVSALPEHVDAALFLTPSSETEAAVKEAATAGVTHMWIQQGSDNAEAVDYCRTHPLEAAVSGECILMFAEPVKSFHKVHRWMKAVFGGLPK